MATAIASLPHSTGDDRQCPNQARKASFGDKTEETGLLRIH